MITSNFQVDGDIFSYADKFWCSSSDDKPSNEDAKDGLINGATLEEVDTGKEFVFDKAENKWTEKKSGEGGGGGSSTLAGFGATYDENEDKITLDKTWNEIFNALVARSAIGQIYVHYGDPPTSVQIMTITTCYFDDGLYGVDADGNVFGCFDPDDYPSSPYPEVPGQD